MRRRWSFRIDRAIYLTIALAMSGCATVPEAPSVQAQVAQFRSGTTTYQDVVAVLGAPSTIIPNRDGSKTVSYDKIATEPPVDMNVTKVLGGADTDTTRAVMMFNSAGVLTTAFYGQWATEGACCSLF